MVNNLNDLIKVAKDFSIPQEQIDSIEKGRLEFITKFPLESIKNLKVDEYCIGTNENSFCYWLEFKDILFGIGGGNATKFGIYKGKDGNYYEGLSQNKIDLKGAELEKKFSKLIGDIIQGLEYVKRNEIENIITIQTPIWKTVLLKIFCIYYPDKFITIGDPDVIIECAKSIELTGTELKNENSILINHLCRNKLNKTEEFSNWGYEKIGTLIWRTFKESAKRNYYIIGSKYGGHKDVFPEMLKRSIVATGYASHLDLSKIYGESQSAIKEFLQSHNEDASSINTLKHFLSLRPGDLVAVKSDGSPKGSEGYLAIVGIAEVVEKNGKVYEYDPKGLGHTINVKYLEAPIQKELSLGGYGQTIHKLSKDEHIKLIFKTNSKMSFFEELNKFLLQAETTDLKTSYYSSHYSGFEVRVSFGQGNQSRIPWIAFLNKIDTVQQGIYPVYLYYKERKLLILAYGVSETYSSNRNWNLSNAKTIEEYFLENGFSKPERYGNSFVFKSYEIDKGLDQMTIDADLSNLLEIYKTTNEPIQKPKASEPFNYNNFHKSAQSAGLYFNEKLCLRFTASLITKPFVILTGLSGSGKTKLAQAFAKWICENEKQYCIVPVGADWTNREPLLGFPNALIQEDYKTDEFGVLRLIIQANDNLDMPYFLILDEMNLSHVERYFADFLSVMESKAKISLHSGNQNWNGIPPEIGFPKNLFIIGTVNIDETTYMFSPKVLDRANVIEFQVKASEMENYLRNIPKNNLVIPEGLGAIMAKDFVNTAADNSVSVRDIDEISRSLMNFFSELKKSGAEFGYRSASEIIRFVSIASKIDPTWSTSEIIDAAIMQKLLPKVHGSRRKLEPILKTLGNFCLINDQKFDDLLSIKTDINYSDTSKIKYPVSLEKILRMYNNLISNGFTSYAEA